MYLFKFNPNNMHFIIQKLRLTVVKQFHRVTVLTSRAKFLTEASLFSKPFFFPFLHVTL